MLHPVALALVLATACTRHGPKAPESGGCEAEVGGASPGVRFASWRDAWAGLRADPWLHAEAEVVPPADEAEARARLCGAGGCAGAGPWLLEHVWDDSDLVDRTDLLFELGPGQLVAQPELGGGLAGRCAWSDQVELVPGPLVHVVTRASRDTDLEVRFDDDGAMLVCGDGDDDCETACFASDVREEDRWFDPATGALVLSVVRVAHPPGDPDGAWLAEQFTFREQLTAVDARHLRLDGAGCSRTLELPAR